MIVSNLFGILSTVLINLIIDRKFAKIEEKEIQEKYSKRIPQASRAAQGGSAGAVKIKDKDKKIDPQTISNTQDKDSARKGGKKK